MKLFGKYRSVREMLETENTKTLQQKFPHGKPMTRRELLNAGAIGFTAAVTLPPILGMLASPAAAEEACKASILPGFLTVNLSGGYSSGSQIVAKDQGRNYLESYDKLGWGSTANLLSGGYIVQDFGVKGADGKMSKGTEFYSGSGIYNGLKDAIANAAVPLQNGKSVTDNTACVMIWSQSQNDSNANMYSADGMINALRQGKLLQNLGTAGNEPAGIRQKPAFKAPPTPVVIGTASDIDNALGVNGIFGSSNNADGGRADALNLSQEQKYNVARTIAHLSNAQCKKIQGANGANELCKLLEQAAGLNVSVISAKDKGTDPLQDPLVSAILNNIWTDMNNTRTVGGALTTLADGSMTKVGAFLTYNVLNGNAATAGIDLGGYDYHGAASRTITDGQDYRAGWMIGQALATAHAMKKAFFIMVTTDGGVDAPPGTNDPGVVDFTADFGTGGGIIMFAYDPDGRPEVSDNKGNPDYQIGHFKAGTDQSVDGTFIVGGTPAQAAKAAFVNYCTFAGKPELISQVLGGDLNVSTIDLLTRIRKKKAA